MVKKKEIKINKSNLGEKWEFVDIKKIKKKYRFGEYFYVNNTIATLCNKAFLLENYEREEGYYILPDQGKIESEIVKAAVSKKRGKASQNLAIIFPYYYENDELKHYTEEEFQGKFPCATKYLMQFKDALSKRAADNNALWFEYGRSQAITKVCEEKLTMPSIVSSRVNVTLEERDVIPCAGYFITQKGEYTLQQAKHILESQQFYEYLRQIGIFTTGKSRRLTVKDIADYTFEKWE